MCKRGSMLLTLAAIALLLLTVHPASGAGGVAFTLKYATLAGMTGDPAIPGQAWTEAGRLAVDYVDNTLKTLGLSDIKVVLSDAQDSQGIPQAGVEAAQKLVNINHVDVIIGDMWSSVTSAVARSVAIPNKVLMFTGGTNPALTKLNTPGTPSIIWQPVPADDLQGRVLASIIGDAMGKTAKINVGARNDAYGSSLAAVFKEVWLAGGGLVPKYVVYNHQQPTLESEAQELVQGNPDGWLFIDFCPTFTKLAQPLMRTGKWDASKSFGSDVLIDCKRRGLQNFPGMRSTQANTSSGTSFPAFKALFEQKAKRGVTFAADLAEPWDSVFVAFLAALEAKSSKPTDVSQHIVSVTNPPGQVYTFQQLDQAIKAILEGKKIHFHGASGPLQFTPEGRVSSTAYDIWQHKPDGTSAVVKTITFKP